jgi:hypothetical protein
MADMAETGQQFVVMATTGKAATVIGGSTLHSFKDGRARHTLLLTGMLAQERLQDVKLVVLDEFSKLKQRDMYYMSRRLQEIMGNDDFFGGLAVILAATQPKTLR